VVIDRFFSLTGFMYNVPAVITCNYYNIDVNWKRQMHEYKIILWIKQEL